MVRNVYGLDLGSSEIKIYDKRQDKIWSEKTVLALSNRTDILAFGNDAFEMYEKTPGNIEVVFPMKEGVISKFDNMQNLLSLLLRKDKNFSRGSAYVVAVPTDVTEVEKKAFFDLVIHSNAKAKEVNIVERSIADAIGLNIDVENTNGVMIANFGGETTEISVLAGGGMVLNKLVKIGGYHYDQAIVNLVRRSQDFLIGMRTAEVLRKEFSVFSDDTLSGKVVSGRDLITGVPMQKNIGINVVRASIKDPLNECVRAMFSLLDRTPPEVRKAIYENGLYITGGIANMKGLEHYIERSINIKTKVAAKPSVTAIRGLNKIVMSKELKKMAYSMLNESYRWMR
ncbi:rod shape-determining protein MreB [Aequitasia blattaphilus]|uniref:Rod shape-determining protein n=1 Tax=Aequitasia blattaphilus TaxID=2949332 RepID=A0ABT1EB06_9FIRM|nr:rod shape-determining protein [Aequitasia blattaphilus]MCP1101692.1 rod shape-determining protein [Aequitasia blattaphilus]MCR8614332.1 rod shape-determining protein [Aequitasia blattaphilus]